MRTRVENGVEYVFKDYIDDLAVWERLANAIIEDAVEEYRIVRDKPDCAGKKRALERFFRSKWFDSLTTLDGRWLLKKLKEEKKEAER